MLSLEQIETRKGEISNAKAGFEQQLAKLERDAAAVRNRLANIAGALELIAMFEKDMENAKTAEQLANEQAEAGRLEDAVAAERWNRAIEANARAEAA